MIQLEECIAARLDIQRSLARLGPRYQEVVRLRFGLDGHGPHTLKEAGEVLGVSVERTRQMEAKAIRSMRYSLDFETSRRLAEIEAVKEARNRAWAAIKNSPIALREHRLLLSRQRAAEKQERQAREREERRLRQIEYEREEQARRDALARKRAHFAPSTMDDLWRWWAGVSENAESIMRDHRMTEADALGWVLR